jgi:hypothetical protein
MVMMALRKKASAKTITMPSLRESVHAMLLASTRLLTRRELIA